MERLILALAVIHDCYKLKCIICNISRKGRKLCNHAVYKKVLTLGDIASVGLQTFCETASYE